jgi:hypothetical protein
MGVLTSIFGKMMTLPQLSASMFESSGKWQWL